MTIRVHGPRFIDADTGRTILYRGVNLGGAKIPFGIPSHVREGFWKDYDRHVSFVGRPFPLSEADEHLSRLTNLGVNLLRFVVTWEAIEHEGPGIYDEAYLDYVIQLLSKCKAHKIKAFIDPHQDAWSRHCGGSGHPGWTHVLAGLNPLHFKDTNAAIVHNLEPEPATLPKMIWNTNYQRLAAATMFTLFFAGKRFAPHCIVNGVNVQDYLQSHYLAAMEKLAERIKANGLDSTVVIGYDTMNEPGQGYINLSDLTKLSNHDTDFKMGLMPTGFQGMLLGVGKPAKVDFYSFKWNGPKKTKTVLVDPQGVQAWLSEEELRDACTTFGWKRSQTWPAGCIWATHNVWDPTTEQLVQPNYFAHCDYSEFWLEFLDSYYHRIRAIHPDALLFVQPPILEKPPHIPAAFDRLVYTPHWYDGLTLVKKQWCKYNIDVINLSRGKYGHGPLRFLRALRVGDKAIRQGFVDQLCTIRDEGREQVGDYPCVMGEIGVPYDMKSTSASTLSSKPSWWSRLWAWLTAFFVTLEEPVLSPDAPQNKAMDASLHACEANLLSYCIWQYMPDNDPVWGDNWNGENLSLWQSPGLGSSTSSTLISQPAPPSDIGWGNSKNGGVKKPLDDPRGAWVLNQRDILALHRPHPYLIAGDPTGVEFVSPTLQRQATWRFQVVRSSNSVCGAESRATISEIHIPRLLFSPTDTAVTMSHGRWWADNISEQRWTLFWEVDEPEGSFELSLQGRLANQAPAALSEEE